MEDSTIKCTSINPGLPADLLRLIYAKAKTSIFDIRCSTNSEEIGLMKEWNKYSERDSVNSILQLITVINFFNSVTLQRKSNKCERKYVIFRHI